MGEVDGMSLIGHWLVWDTEGNLLWMRRSESAARALCNAVDGREMSGPFVPAEQLRGAVSEAQEWKAEAYRLRTIIGEATKQDAGTCKRWLVDALSTTTGGQ